MSDEAAQEPEVPAAPPPDPTGDPRVDEAVARLGELGERPVPGHVEIFEDVHRRLQEILATADLPDTEQTVTGQAGPAQPPPPRPAFPDALRPRP